MKKAIRIGIDARPLSYLLTGIGIYLKCLLENLQEIDTLNHYYLISNAPITIRLKNKKWSKIEGKIKRKLLSTSWMQICSPIAVHKKRIDLFWGPRHHIPVLLPSKTKTIVTIHDIVHRLYPETMALPNLLVERLLMRHSVNRSDAIITDAKSIAKDLIHSYKLDDRKVHTVYPGIPPLKSRLINDETQKQALTSRNPYFLFVGTVEPRKNFERILKAFALIKPELHNVHLVVVGCEGWKNKKWSNILKNNSIRSHIIFTGYVPREMLLQYYRNALCLLYPSIYEGFGFPILEAMSCGTPVITGNTSSMPEVAGDAAILVDPYDIQAISKAMLTVMENKILRDRLSKKGCERIKRFDWRQTAVETMRLFESVIKS